MMDEIQWTAEEQSELHKLEGQDLELVHTDVGRQVDAVVHDTICAIPKMSTGKLVKLAAALTHNDNVLEKDNI